MTSVRFAHKWSILTAVALVSFLGSMDGSVVNAALPMLMTDLRADFATTQWILLAYLLGLTVLQVGMGRLGDLIGKKFVFLAGVVIFLAGSVLCSLSPTVYWLILFRFTQSVGAAMMLSLGSAILTATWPVEERGKAIGFTAGVIAFGIVIGPAIGGFLIEWLNWRWIFYINLPVGALAMILALRSLPALQPKRSDERFDFPGAIVLAVGLLGLVLALTLGQNIGFAQPSILALFAIPLLALPLFLRIERNAPSSLVDLELLRTGDFSRNLFTSLLSFMAIATAVFLLPFYLKLVGGLSASGVGGIMALLPISMGVLQPVAGALSDRVGARRLIIGGLAVMAIGYYMMSTLTVGATPLAIFLRVLPVTVGMAFFYSPNNSQMMGAAPPERLGVASGIASMVRALAQITGIALTGALFDWRVQVYSGLPVDAASPEVLVLALRDLMWLVSALMAVGFVVEWKAWRDLPNRQRATQPPQAPARSDNDSRDVKYNL